MRSALIAILFLTIGVGAGFEAATHWNEVARLENRLTANWVGENSCSSSPPEGAISIPFLDDEDSDHFLGPILGIRTRNLSDRDYFSDRIELTILISPSGEVVSAQPCSGPSAYYDQAVRLAKKWRFVPFERTGKPVYALIKQIDVPIYPPERRPAYKVPFPSIIEWKSLSISLERSACFGTCPIYKLSVHGDGTVDYEGLGFVALTGVHHAKVSRATVQQLFKRFQQAEFFWLFDAYHTDVTDSPAYRIGISFDGRTKRVVDYIGLENGMPSIVGDLENEIDRYVDSNRWTRGDGETGASLMAEGWDFHSKSRDNLTMVAGVAHYGTTQALDDLIADGAPVGPVPSQSDQTSYGAETKSALENAASRGNSEMVRALLDANAGDDREATRRALLASARMGQLPIVQLLALTPGSNLSFSGHNGETPLSAAARSCVPKVLSFVMRFDARVNATDSDGNTPLMVVASRESYESREQVKEDCSRTVELLLKAGANPYLSNHGQTALQMTSISDYVGPKNIVRTLDLWMANHPASEYRK